MYMKFEIIKHFLAPKHKNILMKNNVFYAFLGLWPLKKIPSFHHALGLNGCPSSPLRFAQGKLLTSNWTEELKILSMGKIHVHPLDGVNQEVVHQEH
jgi:hypothetical protein